MTTLRATQRLLLLLLAIATPSTAVAQPTQESARALLDEASAHYGAGRFQEAADTYRRFRSELIALGNERAPLALWNIGLALSRVPGREAQAIDALQHFLEESRSLTNDPEVRDMRSETEAKLGELRDRRGTNDSHPTRIHPVGPVVLASGGAILIAASITGGVSLAQDADFRAACADLTACPRSLQPQYDEMRTISAVADALFVIGGVVAATGLLFTLTLNESADEPLQASCGHLGCVLRGSF